MNSQVKKDQPPASTCPGTHSQAPAASGTLSRIQMFLLISQSSPKETISEAQGTGLGACIYLFTWHLVSEPKQKALGSKDCIHMCVHIHVFCTQENKN